MDSSNSNYKSKVIATSLSTIIYIIAYLRYNRDLIWMILAIVSFIITLGWAYLGITRKE